MDQNEYDLEALDEAQYLLERMLELAERSASDDCQDASRPRLQKGFEVLQSLVDQAMDRFYKGRTAE